MNSKFLISVLCGLLLWSVSCSQKHLDEKYLSKVNSLDNIMTTLYEVISGPADEKRNWELFGYLFKPDAKLIPSGKNEAGELSCRFMSTSEYIQSSGRWLEENGFFEKEIGRTVESFGSLTHVLSAYEAFKNDNDETPFMRGINSIQLLNDGQRWWILNIYWNNESENIKIPKKYID